LLCNFARVSRSLIVVFWKSDASTGNSDIDKWSGMERHLKDGCRAFLMRFASSCTYFCHCSVVIVLAAAGQDDGRAASASRSSKCYIGDFFRVFHMPVGSYSGCLYSSAICFTRAYFRIPHAIAQAINRSK
jgi:hypothetical protein